MAQGNYVTQSANFSPGVTRATFGALLVYPTGHLYENLEADEKVVLVLGKHWVTKVFPAILGGLLFLLPVAGLVLATFLIKQPLLFKYAVIAGWFWLAFVFYYFIALFLRWRSDIYIITNERIIDLDANSIMYKTASDVDLSHIDSVQHASGGGLILGGIDYGDVVVHVVGRSEEVVMRGVPMPAKVALAIGELAEQVQGNANRYPKPA